MASKILVPELGESVIEATVARWLKAEGDAVVIGDPLVELETDKVSVEVGAEQAGVLAKILKADGQDVRVGEEIGIIEEVLGAAQAGSPPKVAPKPKQAAETPAEVARPPAKGGANAAPPPVDPKRSEEAVVDERLSRIQPLRGGSAPEVPRAGTSNAGAMAAPQSSPPAAPPAAPVGTARRVAGERREEVVRLSRRRRTIAQRLVEAQRTAAMLTTFNEVDMGAVMEMRAAYKDAFKERHGVGLGILSFFVKATVVALKAVPPLNSEIRGDDLVLKHFHDIGVAVGATEGLIVPVLRDADLMSFAEIERAIKEYARRSEEGSISLEDLRGGTFTITNGGVFGSLFSTPILNPPEVGILGLHKVEERPVAVKGQVVVRPMMYVALTYDHRVVDGREAVTFLMKVKEAVEDPRRLLLEM